MKSSKNPHIRLHATISDFAYHSINQVELSTLIMNLLENSIRELDNFLGAQTSIGEKNPFTLYPLTINLKIMEESDYLLLFVSNPLFSKPLLDTNGNFISSKNNAQNNHGLGLFTVKKIVSKYEGKIQITTDNDFSVKILLPL